MSTISQFRINGTIDTSQNVLANLILLAQSSGCWVTYDSGTGKWSVVLKQPGNSVKSFDDSNMIGEINISSSAINDIYNIAEITFPNRDLDNTTDYVIATIADSERFQNELDQKLNINFTTINNGAQAQLIAAHDLKQSRFDKVIDFKTDYTSLGEIEAGDIIDITSSMYGFNQKLFRIVQITESDTDDGQLIISVNATEYDADVYDTSGLTIENRSKSNGIPPKITNDEIQADEQAAEGDNLKNLLLATLGTGLFNMLADYQNGSIGGTGGGGTGGTGGTGGGGVTPPSGNDACGGTSMAMGRASYVAPPADPAANSCSGTNSYFTDDPDWQTAPQNTGLAKLNIPRNVTIGDTNYVNSDNDVYTLKVRPLQSYKTITLPMSRFSSSSVPYWAPTSVKGFTKTGYGLPTFYTVTSNTFNNTNPLLVTKITTTTKTLFQGSLSGTTYPNSTTYTASAPGEIIVNASMTSSSGILRLIDTNFGFAKYNFNKVTTTYMWSGTSGSTAIYLESINIYDVTPVFSSLTNLNFTQIAMSISIIPSSIVNYKVTGIKEFPLEITGSYNCINQILGGNYIEIPDTSISGRDPVEIEYQLLVNGQPRGAPKVTTMGYKNPTDYHNPYGISIT